MADFDLSSFADQDAAQAEKIAAVVAEVTGVPLPAPVPQEIIDLAKDAGISDEEAKGLSQSDLLKKVREAVKKPAETKAAEVTPAVAAPAPAVAPGHPPSLIQAARSLGIADHHIQGTSTDFLTDLVLRLNASNVPQQKAPASVDEQEVRIKRLEDEGLTPPDIIAAMRHEHAEKIALKNELAQIHQHLNRQADREGEGMIDAAFDALPPEFQVMFGKGKLSSLPKPIQDARLKQAEKFGITTKNAANAAAILKGWADDVQAAAKLIAKPAVSSAPNGTNGNGKAEKPAGKYTTEEFDQGALAAAVAVGSGLTQREQTLLELTKGKYREWGIDARDEPKQQLDGIPD